MIAGFPHDAIGLAERPDVDASMLLFENSVVNNGGIKPVDGAEPFLEPERPWDARAVRYHRLGLDRYAVGRSEREGIGVVGIVLEQARPNRDQGISSFEPCHDCLSL